MNLTNYTNAQILTITKGIGKLQTSTTKLIHLINLDQIQTALDILHEHTEKSLKRSPLYATLHHEINTTIHTFQTITAFPKTRKTRSLNWLGSGWKYIAGSPDHDDLVMIEQNLDKLIDNNNQQVIINKQLEERINKLTSVSNALTNSIHKSSSVSIEIAISLHNQIRLLKEEIINIRYAIQWARLNVVNTLVLNEDELIEIEKIFKRNNMPPLSMEEIMEFSDVSILHNKTTLLYIVKIPNLEEIQYQDIIIKPIVKNNSIIHLNFQEIFVFKNLTYGIPQTCKTIEYIKICDKKNIVNISNSNCIPKLVQGKKALCSFSNADHVSKTEEVDDGIILLNDYDGNVTWNNTELHLEGTYLVQLSNDSMIIDNKRFSNLEPTVLTPGAPLVQFTAEEKERLKVLSLEALEALHINNTGQLMHIRTHSMVNSITLLTLFGIALILILGLHTYSQRQKSITLQLGPTPGMETKVTAILAPSTCEQSSTEAHYQLPQFNNIPYF